LKNLKDFITDYCSSEHLLFLDPKLKEHAEPLLCFWAEKTSASVTLSGIDELLKQMAHLDLPLEIRKSIPVLLKEFFGYLSSTGRIPQAEHWLNYVSQLEKNYSESFRENGSVKGETFKKKYTDVGRNDSCPCGSGKKFKKCCMKLFT
jgi:uncharacterized protein YecA (UPF0149 family)